MDKKIKIAITGASGWLGRNFVDEIIQMGTYTNHLTYKFFGSTKKIIKNLNEQEIEIYDFYSNAILEFNASHLIHLAFKTADFIDHLSAETYNSVNKEIIARLIEVMDNTDLESIIFTSSGVNENAKGHKNYQDYKDLKSLEKEIILKKCEEKNIKALELRIWAVTGNYLDKANHFAFSQFIKAALKNEDIVINSKNIVNRSYIDAGDLAKIGLTGMLNTEETFINCATRTHINLVDLANLIKVILKSNSKIIYHLKESPREDNYFPQNSNLNSFLEIHDLTILDLKEQIIKTANYLNRSNEF